MVKLASSSHVAVFADAFPAAAGFPPAAAVYDFFVPPPFPALPRCCSRQGRRYFPSERLVAFKPLSAGERLRQQHEANTTRRCCCRAPSACSTSTQTASAFLNSREPEGPRAGESQRAPTRSSSAPSAPESERARSSGPSRQNFCGPRRIDLYQVDGGRCFRWSWNSSEHVGICAGTSSASPSLCPPLRQSPVSPFSGDGQDE